MTFCTLGKLFSAGADLSRNCGAGRDISSLWAGSSSSPRGFSPIFPPGFYVSLIPRGKSALFPPVFRPRHIPRVIQPIYPPQSCYKEHPRVKKTIFPLQSRLQLFPSGISTLFPPIFRPTDIPRGILPISPPQSCHNKPPRIKKTNFPPQSRLQIFPRGIPKEFPPKSPLKAHRHKAGGASLQAELAQHALNRRLAHLPAVVTRSPRNSTATNQETPRQPTKILPSTPQQHPPNNTKKIPSPKQYPYQQQKKRPSPKRRTLNCGGSISRVLYFRLMPGGTLRSSYHLSVAAYPPATDEQPLTAGIHGLAGCSRIPP